MNSRWQNGKTRISSAPHMAGGGDSSPESAMRRGKSEKQSVTLAKRHPAKCHSWDCEVQISSSH